MERRICRAVLAAVGILFFVPGPASAHVLRPRAWTRAYYTPPVIVWTPVYVVPAVPPAPAAPLPRIQAAPMPVGPSTAPVAPPKSTEPPLSLPPAAVSESRSSSGSPRISAKPVNERAAVTFRNLSERDMTLAIEGRSYLLSRGSSLHLDLSRQFVWRIEGQEPELERIPSTNSALEITIR